MRLPVAFVVVLAAIVVAGVAGSGAEAAVAAGCNPSQLTPCAGPVLFGGSVPPACCTALRAQLGCLCGYARSPNFGTYVRSPNAARLFAVCRLPMPRCA